MRTGAQKVGAGRHEHLRALARLRLVPGDRSTRRGGRRPSRIGARMDERRLVHDASGSGVGSDPPARALRPLCERDRAPTRGRRWGSVNAILSRVETLRRDGRLERFDLGKTPSCVLLTPRFRTSRHVVALLIPSGAGEPKLVVKMPRLAGDDDGIAREARVLTALREKSPSASESIPEVLTCEDGDRPLLVE